jgi:hypothetical protein
MAGTTAALGMATKALPLGPPEPSGLPTPREAQSAQPFLARP